MKRKKHIALLACLAATAMLLCSCADSKTSAFTLQKWSKLFRSDSAAVETTAAPQSTPEVDAGDPDEVNEPEVDAGDPDDADVEEVGGGVNAVTIEVDGGDPDEEEVDGGDPDEAEIEGVGAAEIDAGDPDEAEEVNAGTVTTVTAGSLKDSSGYTYYVCPESGSYEFTAMESDGVEWMVYLLDEEFDDALRYIAHAYTPSLTGDGKLSIREGQYIYIYCSANAFTGTEAPRHCQYFFQRK